MKAAEIVTEDNKETALPKDNTPKLQMTQEEHKTETLLVRFCVEIVPELIQNLKTTSDNEMQLHEDVLHFYRQGKLVFKTCTENAGNEDRKLDDKMRSDVINAMERALMSISNGKNIYIPSEIAEGAKEVEHKFIAAIRKADINDKDFFQVCAKAVKDVKNLIRDNFMSEISTFLGSRPTQTNSMNFMNAGRYERSYFDVGPPSTSAMKCKYMGETKRAYFGPAKLINTANTSIRHVYVSQTGPAIRTELKTVQNTIPSQSRQSDNDTQSSIGRKGRKGVVKCCTIA